MCSGLSLLSASAFGASLARGRTANENIQAMAVVEAHTVRGDDRPGLLWVIGHDMQPHLDRPTPAPEPVGVPDVRAEAPIVRTYGLSQDDWGRLIAAYDWPVAEVERVMRCESSFNANARNGSSVGLLQINTAAHPYTVAQMLDPAQNVAAAYAIWADGRTWAAWSCRP